MITKYYLVMAAAIMGTAAALRQFLEAYYAAGAPQ